MRIVKNNKKPFANAYLSFLSSVENIFLKLDKIRFFTWIEFIIDTIEIKTNNVFYFFKIVKPNKKMYDVGCTMYEQ